MARCAELGELHAKHLRKVPFAVRCMAGDAGNESVFPERERLRPRAFDDHTDWMVIGTVPVSMTVYAELWYLTKQSRGHAPMGDMTEAAVLLDLGSPGKSRSETQEKKGNCQKDISSLHNHIVQEYGNNDKQV